MGILKMKKNAQYDIFEYLSNNVNFSSKQNIDTLYQIWSNDSLRTSKNVYKIPNNIKTTQVESMQNQGLVNKIGDKIQITSKGSDIIKILVLGDERSVFEDNGKPLSYKEASLNVKKQPIRKKK